MNTALKLGLLTGGLALAMHVPTAQAVVATHVFSGTSVNYCQAFTPGPANTVRNRVVGAENVGATVNVACTWHSLNNGAAGNANPRQLEVWFSNNSAAAITVTCSLLTGYQGDPSKYISTKTTASIAPAGAAQEALDWVPADNPVAGATDLGNALIGINCTLPTGAVINDTYLVWNQDNGVGS